MRRCARGGRWPARDSIHRPPSRTADFRALAENTGPSRRIVQVISGEWNHREPLQDSLLMSSSEWNRSVTISYMIGAPTD
jgi:hypothetical protein